MKNYETLLHGDNIPPTATLLSTTAPPSPSMGSHKSQFTKPKKNNPLMNVLLPEIKYNPKRKMAAPSFNRAVEKEINKMAGNVGPDPRLFLDLGDSVSFEQSMRNFYSTANTKVPNDQTAFAKYCYGDMPSCKEGDAFQCTKDNQRYTLY